MTSSGRSRANFPVFRPQEEDGRAGRDAIVYSAVGGYFEGREGSRGKQQEMFFGPRLCGGSVPEGHNKLN